ncbi:uncharacterized protein LOC129319712 [Prosopis cineraria]|uniref:uncharacterized protein LOC129319712 n=1 Tax=Prosopis cineraria TaxID=364024 RepID=UPI00240F6CFE|nr:uncharacterized protein LOC129319712 [Prosopis cineraria]
MSNALFAKNKIGFIDGSIPTPTADSSDLNHWMRCNAMVKGWLKSAMNKEIRSSVRYAKTAQEIWVDLEERFGKGSAPRSYDLRRTIAHTRQDKQSIPTYFTKLKGYWDELNSIMPWPKCACGGLAEDEQQKQISATYRPTMEASAFQVQNDQRDGKHDKPRCNHCNKLGHIEDKRYELIGYPPDWKKGGHEKKDKKFVLRVAQVSEDATSSLIPGITADQFSKLIEFFGTNGKEQV